MKTPERDKNHEAKDKLTAKILQLERRLKLMREIIQNSAIPPLHIADYITKIDDVNIELFTERQEMLAEKTYSEKVDLNPSSKTGDVQVAYKHTCQMCGGQWIGTAETPAQCKYCDSRLWRGFSKWEERHREQHKRKM